MKNQIQRVSFILLSMLFCGTVQAQFNTVGLVNYGNTDANIIGIGIGDWAPGGVTNARLHVNNFLCNNPVGGLNGLLFRTDGNSTVSNNWTMFTGPNVGALQQVFNLTIPANSTNVNLNASNIGNMNFQTGGIQRMTILGTNAAVADQGNVGIGLPNPDMPLCVRGGTNDVTTAGWRRGVHLFDRAVLCWDRAGAGNSVVMGHPTFGVDHSFFCFLATNTTSAGVVNNVYRITDIPVANVTPPNSGDMQFFHNILADDNIGIGLGTGVTTLLTPTNRLEVNTTAITGGVAPVVVAPNGNSGFLVGNTGGGTGFSGLRFTDLRSGSTPFTTNPGLGVLSVDANGDVIYVPGGAVNSANNGLSISTVTPGVVVLGQNINQVGNPSQLLSFREIPMNNNNFYFLGQSTTQGINSVGVGFDPNVWGTMPAKLGAYDDAGSGLGMGRTAVLGWNRNFANSASNQQFSGVTGIADGQETINNKIFHYGGLFTALHAPVNYGVYGKVNGTDPIMLNNYGGRFETDVNHSTASNVGALVTSTNGNSSIGVSIISNNASTFNEGLDVLVGNAGIGNSGVIVGANILAQTLNSTATGSGGLFVTVVQNNAVTNFPSGFFDGGDVVTTFNFVTISDSTCKTNIHDCSSSLDLINQLHPVTYDYRVNDMQPNIHLPAGNHFGLLAQEVEAILPSLVHTVNTAPQYDTSGVMIQAPSSYKGVSYTEIIPILVDAIQEQQELIDSQNTTISALQQQLNDQQQQIDDLATLITNCCSNGNLQAPNNTINNSSNGSYQNVPTTDVRLSDTYCVLGENSPNPFKDHTVINYTLSETIQSAQIVFYNTLGQVIKVLDINDRGEGRLNVYAEDLRSGMYTYSLIIDGNVCESKKMIKE